MQMKSVIYFGFLIIIMILGLANSGMQPVSSGSGYTGAPGDSNCASCHTGNNSSIDGNIVISGLPDTINTNTTYKITVTVSNPNSMAKKAGFQLVALTGTNTNAGSMTNNSTGSDLRTVFGGKTYFGHAPADTFPASRTLTYTVDWTSPSTQGINPVIKFYSAGLIANGDNNTSGDKVVTSSIQIPIRTPSSPLSVNIFDVTAAKCADSLNGAAKAVPSGGSGVYRYLWNNGVTTGENISMGSGLNSVTVTDNAGASVSATVTIPSPPSITISFNSSSVCDSSTIGTITALPAGGFGSFSYLWSTGSTANVLESAKAGIYTITVTDQNNCKKAAQTSLTVLPPLQISKITSTPSCKGLSNGSISLSVKGGASDYKYLWSNQNTNAKIQNIHSGTYSVTVSDTAGCSISDTFILLEPDTLIGIIEELKDPKCFGAKDGSIKIKVTGGTPDYQFAWSDGSANSGNSSNISNLSAGLYKVTITDLQDCSTIKEIELKQPEIISISETIKNVNCHGGSDGSINITISGTQNPVLYKWSTSDSLKNINNLKVGTYFVTVTDTLKKCLALDTFQVSQPEPLLLKSDSILNNVCKGDAKGQASIQIQGGTKNYKYLWSNKDSTSVLTNLTAGNYHYSVTDANHCTLTGSLSVNEPTGIKISVDSTKNPKCKEVGDGFISIKVGDNQGPFTVKWSNGENGLKNDSLFSGNYIVKITDSLFCTATDTIKLNANPGFQLPVIEYKDVKCFGDSTGAASVKMNTLVRYLWSTGDTSNIVSKLPAGKYSLIATDKNGCKSIADTINIVQPQPIKSELLTSDTLICPGFRNGSLSIKASGGKDALTLKWNTGDTLSKIMSLSPGMYTVTITDKNLCKTTQSYRINTTDTLRISDKKVPDIFCYDTKRGGIEFKVRGGFGSLKYSWSDTSVTGSVISGLAHGLYSVTVNDQQGCLVTDTFRVNKVDSIMVTAKVTNETISGKSDGKVELSIIGGTAPFLVVWSNGRTGAILDNMPPGLFNYTIEDKNKCLQTGSIVIDGGVCLLSATVKSIKPATCFNSSDGKVELDIKGNFQKYNIEIYNNSGQYKLPIDSLKPDSYLFIISDSVNCSAIIFNATVTSITTPIVLDKIIKYGPGSASLKNGRMEAIMKGGTRPLKFTWFKDNQKVGDSSLVEGQTTGVYQLTVIDSAGCELKINNIQLDVMTSADDFLLEKLKLYPNPVSENLYLKNNTGLNIKWVEIHNSSGQLVLATTDLPGIDTQLIDFQDVSGLKAGIYFLKILIDDKLLTKRFIVLH